MKLLFIFFCTTTLLGVAECACGCYPNQYAASNIVALSFNGPSDPPGFGGSPCAPFQCNTTLTFNGYMSNGLPAGANITIIQCQDLSSDNTVSLFVNGQLYQTFMSCPSKIPYISNANGNVLTFAFKLTTPITFLAVLNPTLQYLTTTPPPTTPLYQGPFSNNPAISRMDLTIGFDISAGNQPFYIYSKEVITNIVKYFTYNDDFVRLSLMMFDPENLLGTGQYPLWTLNISSMAAALNDMPLFPGIHSDYEGALQKYFFDQLDVSPLRENTERIFIIFVGTDSMPTNDNFGSVNSNIDQNDIKLIFVNMNASVTISNPNNFPYPELQKLSGTLTNKAHWYDYQIGGNSAENILYNIYFNGNTLCNSQMNSTTISMIPLKYSFPQDSSKLYCNYMNTTQIYVNPNLPQFAMKLTITQYSLSENKDFLLISTGDGNQLAVLTGNGSYQSYCTQASSISVTLQTFEGLVYHGYQSSVAVVSLNDC